MNLTQNIAKQVWVMNNRNYQTTAELCQVSTRTIRRYINGETTPNVYAIKRMQSFIATRNGE